MLRRCPRPYFNPRAPCGARRAGRPVFIHHRDFNPRAPCGARRHFFHTPFSESYDFNPRAPCGARLYGFIQATETCGISTHAPLAGRDRARRNTIDLVLISTHAPLAGRDSKSVQITMHIFAITDKFQMLLHRMPPVRAFCSFLMQENHADFGCEPPK